MNSSISSPPPGTVVVFGARGCLGSRLGARLTAQGLDWTAAPASTVCDLADARAVGRFLDDCAAPPLRIVNLAVVGKFADNTSNGLRRNLAMIAGLRAALRDRDVAALVQASSLDVYGTNPPQPLTEDSPTAPVDCYGRAKLVTERMLGQEAKLAPVCSVVRLPGLYAADAGDNGVVATFWRLVRSGAPVTVRGTGAARRDYLCLDDACDALTALALAPTGAGRLNLGTGESLSIAAILERMGRACGRRARLDFVAGDGRDFDIVLDTARLRRQLPQWRPTPLSERIEHFPGALAPAADTERP